MAHYMLGGNTKKEAITKPQKVTKFLEPSDSSDSYAVEYQGSTYTDYEPSDRTLRAHAPKIQVHREDTIKENLLQRR
jgi:hypothetical protein